MANVMLRSSSGPFRLDRLVCLLRLKEMEIHASLDERAYSSDCLENLERFVSSWMNRR